MASRRMIGSKPRGGVQSRPPGLYSRQVSEVRSDILLPGQMPRSRFFRPAFSLRWGRRGRGKTLTLVADGYHFQQAYEQRNLRDGWLPPRADANGDMQPGQIERGKYPWLVAANFQNAHADITRPFLVEELTEYPAWAWNMRLQIDEIAMYAHRRKWQLTSNLNLESFITQIRKRSIEPSAATQFPQRLDGDLVEQIDLFIDCDIEIRGCGNPEHSFCAAQRVHDWWGQWTGNTKRKPWPPNVWEYDTFKWFHNCKQFFGSYVTEEIHSPIWLKDGEKNRIRLKQWGEETDLAADEAAYEAAQAIKAATGPVDVRYSRDEMEEWEEYSPDLSLGAPGEDQLAEFLRDKASRQPGGILNLSVYVREAANIDPNVNGLRALTEFCRKHGWETKRDQGSTIAFVR